MKASKQSGKTNTETYLKVKTAVGLRHLIDLTPAKLAALIEEAVRQEGEAKGRSGELTLGKARRIAKNYGLNKKIRACLETRARRASSSG